MWIRSSKYYVVILYVLILATILTGCDNTLEPFERGKGLYSIYGALDLNKDINYIRVKDLNEPLISDKSDSLDATVTLENINQNETEILQDSLVKFEDVYTHNFRTTLPINPDTEYEITVERSDGESIKVTTTTPNIADVSWGPTDEFCSTPIEIIFEPIFSPNDLEISVGFDYENVRYWSNPDPRHFEDEKVTYYFAPINILSDVFSPPDSEPIECYQLDNEFLYVKYTHYGPDFGEVNYEEINAPEGTIDFGAYYEDSFSFPIDTTKEPPLKSFQ